MGRKVYFQRMWRVETESVPPVSVLLHLRQAWKAAARGRMLLAPVPVHVLAMLCRLWEPSSGLFVPMYQPAEASYHPLEILPTPALLHTPFDSSCRWEWERKRAKSWRWGGGDQRHRWNKRSNYVCPLLWSCSLGFVMHMVVQWLPSL